MVLPVVERLAQPDGYLQNLLRIDPRTFGMEDHAGLYGDRVVAERPFVAQTCTVVEVVGGAVPPFARIQFRTVAPEERHQILACIKVVLEFEPFPTQPDTQLAAFRNQKLGFVFQSFHLINSLNIIDNVELPLLYRPHVSAKQRRELALSVIEKVGLSHRMRHFPTQLSGGQCQRVAIARAIIGNPDIILADEPTGNLDSKMGAEVMEILHKLNREDGRTIVMVTHNEQQAKETSRTVQFFDGRQVS